MGDAPKRIWAWIDMHGDPLEAEWHEIEGEWTADGRDPVVGTEYIRADALEAKDAKIARLRKALEAAEAWIVDGGYLDDRDPYTAESAAAIYTQTRAALAEGDTPGEKGGE
jgi:hypothetical protein